MSSIINLSAPLSIFHKASYVSLLGNVEQRNPKTISQVEQAEISENSLARSQVYFKGGDILQLRTSKLIKFVSPCYAFEYPKI